MIMEKDDDQYLQALAETTTISENSRQLYIYQLKALAKLFPGLSYDAILKQPKASYRQIKKAYPNLNTQRSYIAAIKALFKHVDGLQCVFKNEAEKWNDIYMKLSSHINTKVENAILSDREVKNWVEWPVVIDTVHTLEKNEYGSIRHLLLACYTYIEPLRQDYGYIRITKRDPSDPTENYMVFGKNKTTLYLNNYKTAKKYNTLIRPIPDKLRQVILHSLKQSPRKYLFVDTFGNPYKNRNSYTKFCNKILYSIFQPKKVTVSTLRHSFISSIDYNRALPGQLFKVARYMAHSVAQQQLYRRKPNNENINQSQDKHKHLAPSSSIYLIRDNNNNSTPPASTASTHPLPPLPPSSSSPTTTRWINI
jgi:hypothetical protein